MELIEWNGSTLQTEKKQDAAKDGYEVPRTDQIARAITGKSMKKT
jgi:hypothetical protein